MTDRRRIEYTTDMDSRGFERGTQRVTGGLKKVAQFAAAAFAADRVVDFVGQALQLASAAEEIDSKFTAVFGSAEELRSNLSALGDVAGITDADILSLSATFGNLAQTQGIMGDELSDLTLDVAALAGDLASFNDQDPARVFENLTKGILTTEREGLKPLGIAVSEVEVKQRALARAVEDGRSEATKADRAWASYAIVVEQSGKAIGDLNRTSDSAANQQRQLKATITELQTEIGRELLPVMADLLEIANELTPALKGVARGVSDMVSPIAGLARAANDADTEGKRWYQTLGDLTIAAYKLIPGLGQAINYVEDLNASTDDAAVSFQEFGSASPYIEGALAAQIRLHEDAAAAASATADATEDAERRVAAAVDRWVGVLGNLQAAYERTATKAAAEAFLAPGGGDDRGPEGPEFGRRTSNASNTWNQINGTD